MSFLADFLVVFLVVFSVVPFRRLLSFFLGLLFSRPLLDDPIPRQNEQLFATFIGYKYPAPTWLECQIFLPLSLLYPLNGKARWPLQMGGKRLR